MRQNWYAAKGNRVFDLFRFIMMRPAEKADPASTIPIAGESKFRDALAEARQGQQPLADMKVVANDFLSSSDFVADTSTLVNAAPLAALGKQLDQNLNANLNALDGLVQSIFSEMAMEVIANPVFRTEKRRLQDTLIAIKLILPVPRPDVDQVTLFLRLINLIERIAGRDATLNQPGSVEDASNRLIVLPGNLFPLPSPLTGVGDGVGSFARRRGAGKSSAGVAKGSKATLASARPAVVADATARAQALRDAFDALKAIRPQDLAITKPPAAPQRARVTSTVAGKLKAPEFGLTMSPTLTVHPKVIAAIPAGVKSTLQSLNIDLATISLPAAVQQVATELSRVPASIATTSLTPQSNIARVGTTFFPVSEIPDVNQEGDSPPPELMANLPMTHGKIQPIGVADLLVVKQNIKRYEAGELADIRNILKGESNNDEVRRAETVTQSTTIETQSTKEEERDLQTTERFELKNQTQGVISEDGTLASGSPLSPSYGPVLEFQTGDNSPIHGSQQASTSQASAYSKDVTTRAATKVSESIKTSVLVRTTREFSEKTAHGYDNSKGLDNVVGIFQWVDKIYDAQVYNYGKRLMYDMVVPEPAAFWIAANAVNSPEGQGLIKPDAFTIDASQIDETNWFAYAEKYGATGIDPPPPVWKVISTAFADSAGQDQNIHGLHVVTIPDGYAAQNMQYWFQTIIAPGSGGDSGKFQIWAGVTRVGGPSSQLNGEIGTISVVLVAVPPVLTLFVNIDFYCLRNDDYFKAWQTKAHDAILQAYQKQLDDYEQRLANLQAAMQGRILGRSPAENASTIRTELKKNSITVFTYQEFDAFGAIQYSSQGFPQIDFTQSEVQGPYMRFFEQAFEWEQMTYFFYPYFWGRKDNWSTNILYDDADPDFADFLRAGAARVLIPVRPGYEKALAHFMETGEIWTGGGVPDVTSPDYVSLIQEIQESEGAPLDEVPQGDPWEVRLTTTLVRVRSDTSLPSWIQDTSGNWVPANK